MDAKASRQLRQQLLAESVTRQRLEWRIQIFAVANLLALDLPQYAVRTLEQNESVVAFHQDSPFHIALPTLLDE
jgi:hypothetical protein